ncbi:MAG: hypothetical protein H6719_34225, partial [Sandaracinaceae bacterium]|nr:hypothetical protein [Sandaracinaceae bacterium]
MAEITLTLLLEPVETADAFDAALAKRRWTRVEALPSTWTCYFDAAFLEQVERIMTSDVEGAAAEAGVKRWRGVGAVAAIPTSVVGPADAAPVRRPAREVWADGATPVGPLGEVVVTFDAATEPLGA